MAVTDEMRFRLSQSVQKTLQLGKDLMFVAPQPPEGGEKHDSDEKMKSSNSAHSQDPPLGGGGAMYSKL